MTPDVDELGGGDVAEDSTEYEWLVPDGPADPYRAWAWRDCGDGAEGVEDDDG